MRYLKNEELEIAKRFLFLSMAIIVMENDIQHIKTGPFKIKEPYLKLLEKMIAIALVERKNLRETMKRKTVKIVQLHKNDSFSSYLFICQGREKQCNYFNPAIRQKVDAVIQGLMYEALPQFQPYASANT